MTKLHKLIKPLALAAFLFGALALHPSPARAVCSGTIPYIFTNNASTVDANTTNSNNAFLFGCVTTVDNSQIGGLGIYANQIIPISPATATFGGSQPYSFPGLLYVANSVEAGPSSVASPGTGYLQSAINGSGGYGGSGCLLLGNATATQASVCYGQTSTGVLTFGVNGTNYFFASNGGNISPSSHINQQAANQYSGTCTMSTATTCSQTIPASYTSQPNCFVTEQSNSSTVVAGACYILAGSTTVLITAAASNSFKWSFLLIGNPN